jgi:hypothetical protein
MDKTALEKLKAGEWGVVHTVGDWQPWTGDSTPPRSLELTTLDLDL